MNTRSQNAEGSMLQSVIAVLSGNDFRPGVRINEKQLAERFGVSRTPVRAALEALEKRGITEYRHQSGFYLLEKPRNETQPAAEIDPEDAILAWIARDRKLGELPEEVTAVEIAQRYGKSRLAAAAALERLASFGIVRKKMGYGWQFISNWNAKTRDQSYRYRLVIEPAAILEPGFRLSSSWIEEMRVRHKAIMKVPWTEASSIAFFETNAEFHETIAAASGNHFFAEAIRSQNKLRRFSLYDWTHGAQRIRDNFREHMSILDALHKGDQKHASAKMRDHLQIAWALASKARRLKSKPTLVAQR
jgi:DNA-binding GntR family transcriptional regulator